jgi:hypothetical protein
MTIAEVVPAFGVVAGALKAKTPGTEAAPPFNVDDASV